MDYIFIRLIDSLTVETDDEDERRALIKRDTRSFLLVKFNATFSDLEWVVFGEIQTLFS